MKFFLALFTLTMSLGSSLAMKFSPDSFYLVIIYILGVYQLYRVNYDKAFFLTFLRDTKEEKQDQVKLRLGLGEFDIKDEAEKNEDKFHDMFDWKKLLVRQVMSWGLFAASIYMFFFRLRVEVSMETVMPLIAVLFITRAVSVGHLLVPLSINLITTLFILPEFTSGEYIVFGLYAILFIINLALIYPSEERLSLKVKEWLSGKWVELLSTIGILLITFMAGKYVFGDLNLHKEPEARKVDVQRTMKKIARMESSIKRMTEQGIFQNKSLRRRSRELSEKVNELSRQEKKSSLAWVDCKDGVEKLEKDIGKELAESNVPALSEKLLEEMKADTRSRLKGPIDPMTEKMLEDFLKRAENFKGSEDQGKDLIADYRKMKYGKGGFFQEETEFDHDPTTESSIAALEEMKKAAVEKKDISEKLNRNIEELKSVPDDGKLALNKSLKEELEHVDSVSSEEREVLKKEFARADEVRKDILSRTKLPELRERLEKLEEENNHLKNELTPHMNAQAKSELAEKILKHQKDVEAAGQEVKSEIRERVEKKNNEDPPDEENDYSALFNKLIKFGSVAMAGILIAWFMNKLKKKGIKKVEGIPEELKEDIIQDLKALKRRDLSPREEVIETYNVFHNALQSLVFHSETPPSCIVYEGIRKAEPELKDSTFTVTEIFALTFYGNRDVSGSDLKAFRRDVKSIFSYFGITF